MRLILYFFCCIISFRLYFDVCSVFFFFKQKTAYELRISDWSSDVGSSDLIAMYEESGEQALRTMREIWQQVFATKPAEWKYERERRLLVQTDRDDAAPVLRRYGRDAIKEVILGERMPEEYRARVIAVMQE